MKSVILLSVSICILACKREYKSIHGYKTDKTTQVVFDEKSYDFGRITEGDTVIKTYHFKNSGKHELVITKLSVSCGCTYPDFPKEPVLPGRTDSITLKFSSKTYIGRQLKTVKVFTNSVPGEDTLTLKGVVVQ
jgi:hypothetical protein